MKIPPKIVVLEDNRASLAIITHVLEKAGYDVYGASEGRGALELVMKERPALLVSDVMLPDMNGSEVVKQLLATSFGSELNAIFVTSLLGKKKSPGEETILKVADREFPALSKPIKPDVLLKIVERLIGKTEEVEDAEITLEGFVDNQAGSEESSLAETEANAEG